MSTSRAPGFGDRLRRIREDRNWTQEQLAEQIGVSVASINRWEHEKAYPRADQRRGLCAALHVPAEELFGRARADSDSATPAATGGMHSDGARPAAAGDGAHPAPPHDRPPSGRVGDDSPFWHVRPVREMNLGDPLLKQGGRPVARYFARAEFQAVREAVRAAVRQQHGGVVLFGPPMIGKTRMALEALRCEAPDFLLLPWPRHEIAPSALDMFAGCPVALLLDDLQEMTHYHESGEIVAAVRRLLATTERLIVVATSRSGADEAATRRHFEGLFESLGLQVVQLAPMEPDATEGAEFLAFVRALAAAEPERHLHFDAFDGTPGSVLLGLERRTTQLRSPAFPASAKAILKALAVLRVGAVYAYPELRVRRIAEGVFDLAAGQWSDALDYLVGGGWVSLDEGDLRGESRLYVPSDAYLDVCLPASGVYPRSKRSPLSDFPLVAKALAHAPTDSEALILLSRAIYDDQSSVTSKWVELGLDCAQQGLAPLDPQRDALLWARGQCALGLSYWKRWLGDFSENMRRAVVALKAAETVLTREDYPSDWAVIQRALGIVYLFGKLEPKDDLLDEGIACLQHALQVHTREAYPFDWARAHNALGDAYGQRTRGVRDDNLRHAIEHFLQAAQVLTLEAHPNVWPMVMRNLGEAYGRWGEGDVCANEQTAMDYCQQVLDAGMREISPYDWARTQCVLAGIHHHRRTGDPERNLRAAVTHYAAALEVLTPGEYAPDHQIVLAGLTQAQADLAALARPAGSTEQSESRTLPADQ